MTGQQAAAALRLADEQTEEIRRREEKLRQLGLQIAEAEQRFSATTLAPAPALGFTGTVTSDVREGGYISEQQNKSGKKQEESRADREKIGAESEGRGSKRDETVQEKAKNKGKGKETGAGEETERKQLAPKRKSARGLAEQRPGEVANEGPDVLEVEQVKLTALRLQLVSNEAALRLGQQKLLSASGAAGAEIEGEDALQQTLQKLSAADRQLGEEQVRLSGGGLGGGDSLAGKESAEANSGGAVSSSR